MPLKIAEAQSADEIARCYPVMRQLRTHFTEEAAFVAQVQRQRKEGYRLASLEDEGEVRAVAGYRILEWLFGGRYCYIDDLVTDENKRSLGYGDALFDWLVGEARAAGCKHFDLDSGVQRFAAHRFYLRKRMIIASHHFSLDL